MELKGILRDVKALPVLRKIERDLLLGPIMGVLTAYLASVVLLVLFVRLLWSFLLLDLLFLFSLWLALFLLEQLAGVDLFALFFAVFILAFDLDFNRKFFKRLAFRFGFAFPVHLRFDDFTITLLLRALCFNFGTRFLLLLALRHSLVGLKAAFGFLVAFSWWLHGVAKFFTLINFPGLLVDLVHVLGADFLRCWFVYLGGCRHSWSCWSRRCHYDLWFSGLRLSLFGNLLDRNSSVHSLDPASELGLNLVGLILLGTSTVLHLGIKFEFRLRRERVSSPVPMSFDSQVLEFLLLIFKLCLVLRLVSRLTRIGLLKRYLRGLRTCLVFFSCQVGDLDGVLLGLLILLLLFIGGRSGWLWGLLSWLCNLLRSSSQVLCAERRRLPDIFDASEHLYYVMIILLARVFFALRVKRLSLLLIVKYLDSLT